MQRTANYNTDLMVEDMNALGLQPVDVARRCGFAASTMTRFLNGQHRTPRVAKRIAKALRQPLDRYVIRSAEAVAS